jgi:hypothetical protein
MLLPAIIFIEVLEGSVKMLFSVHSVHMHCCCDEFVIVYGPIAICISLFMEEIGGRKTTEKSLTDSEDI